MPAPATALLAAAAPLIGAPLGRPDAAAAESLLFPVDWLGFEARLHGGDRSVDLGVRLSRPCLAAGPPFLARPDSGEAASGDARDRLERFLDRWRGEIASDPCDRMPFVHLEIDAVAALAAPAPLPVPSIFVALDWALEELANDAGSRDLSAGLGAIGGTLRLLCRDQLASDRDEARLRECLKRLPLTAVALHVAFMLGRADQATRLSVGVPRHALEEYLVTLGWQAGRDEVATVLRDYAAVTDFAHPAALVQLDFDLGAHGLGEQAGITLRPRMADGWPALLDALHARGLCDRDRREALLDWSGGAGHDLSHVKVVCRAQTPLRAKAYFGITAR